MNNQDIFDKALAAGVEYPYLERYQYDDWYTTTGKLYNLSLYTGTVGTISRKNTMIIHRYFSLKSNPKSQIRSLSQRADVFVTTSYTPFSVQSISLHRNGGMRSKKMRDDNRSPFSRNHTPTPF